MLEGKIALVTGASRGIGRQIALTLGREGAAVIVNYNGSAAKAEEVVKEIEAAGGKAEAVQCNVSDFESCGRMMADVVSRYGRLDILVNNAGITRDNLLMKMSEEDFDAVISTNLKGVFNCIKHISRQMLKQKAGRIINISSVSGVLGNAGQANYCAAKAGVIGITKSAAKELAIDPVVTSTHEYLGREHVKHIAVNPQTDVPLQLALAHTLYSENLYDKNFLANYCVGFEQFLPYLLGEKDADHQTKYYFFDSCYSLVDCF